MTWEPIGTRADTPCETCSQYVGVHTSAGVRCVDHFPEDYPRCEVGRCCFPVGHIGSHNVKGYIVTDPDMIASLNAQMDAAVVAAVVDGLCAAPSCAVGQVCLLQPGHDGEHRSAFGRWGGEP